MCSKRVYRTVIVESSGVVARGVKEILTDTDKFTVVGVCDDLSYCVDRLSMWSADVILVNHSVVDCSFRLSVKTKYPELQHAALVAILSNLHDVDQLRQYDAVISIYDTPTKIVKSIADAVEKHSTEPKTESAELSGREKEILISVAQGKTNKDIADEHNISIYTVISHRKNITRKTGIKTVAGLTVYALLNNLIDS